MKIGVIVAMDKEFVQLKSLLENSQMEQDNHLSFVKGRIKQNEIVLMQCGIGKVNAAIGAVEMIHRYQPQLIVSSGCALVNKALSLSYHKNIKSGLIVSGDWFVDSREKMQHILLSFPKAAAVDMESGAIAQTCYLYHIPFISFRIISDVPLKDTEASQYYNFWEQIAHDSFEVTKDFLQKS